MGECEDPVLQEYTVLLSVDGKETIDSIKARIKEISSQKETILYGKYKKLEDHKTLEENGIVSHSRLYLKVPGPPGSMELHVDLDFETCKTITVHVEPGDTVEDLKYNVYEKENIWSNQQQILFEKKQLANHRTLSSYGI